MNADQFKEFAKFLVQRSGLPSWPEPSSEYWRDFHRQLNDIRAGYDEADAASRRACNQPKMFINDFRPFVLAEIPKIREERRRASADSPAVAVAAPPPLPPRPDGPEVRIETPADLRRFCASLAASFSAGRAIYRPPSREARQRDARALARRPELGVLGDDVIDRERARVPALKPPDPSFADERPIDSFF